MINHSLHMPGFRESEYQLAILPHSGLREKIAATRKEFSSKYLGGKSAYGNAHLSLVKFYQLEMLEEKLVHRIKTIAMGYHPFKVELKGYGSFPSHSIFINVTSKVPLNELVRELKTAQRLMKSGDKDPHFLQDPHFLIARKLLPWQYEQGWQEYSQRAFTGRFIADSMLLLKRRSDEKNFQVIERLEFMNLPVIVKQGELFGHSS